MELASRAKPCAEHTAMNDAKVLPFTQVLFPRQDMFTMLDEDKCQAVKVSRGAATSAGWLE